MAIEEYCSFAQNAEHTTRKELLQPQGLPRRRRHRSRLPSQTTLRMRCRQAIRCASNNFLAIPRSKTSARAVLVRYE